MHKQILLHILARFRRADRCASAALLKIECDFKLEQPIGDREFETALGELLDKQLVDYQIDALTNDKKYTITEAGLNLINKENV